MVLSPTALLDSTDSMELCENTCSDTLLVDWSMSWTRVGGRETRSMTWHWSLGRCFGTIVTV